MFWNNNITGFFHTLSFEYLNLLFYLIHHNVKLIFQIKGRRLTKYGVIAAKSSPVHLTEMKCNLCFGFSGLAD